MMEIQCFFFNVLYQLNEIYLEYETGIYMNEIEICFIFFNIDKARFSRINIKKLYVKEKKDSSFILYVDIQCFLPTKRATKK